LVLALGSACGGKSFVGDGDGDEGGTTARGGSSGVAGSAARGGSSSTAGTGVGRAGKSSGGGSSAGAGATGGSGIAGAGGSPDPACTASPDAGPCDAYLEVWYNDPTTGICRPSFYGGCGGNANRYSSLAECQRACPDQNPNWDSCSQPSDCLVAGSGCCGVCEAPDLTTHDFIAYNRKYEGSFSCGFAADLAAPPGGAAPADPIACAPCPQPAGNTLRNFVPDCVAGQCVVADLRTSPTTACTQSSECRLRSGTSCCEGCDSSNLIAVRNDGSFEKLICSGISPPCAACAPAPPSGAIAVCDNGRCAVAYSATQ